MRETFRPYCKIVTLSDQDRTSIALKDSEGNSLECNYVQVTAVSGGATGALFAVSPPLATLGEGAADFPAASGIVTHGTASGTCGQLAKCDTGTITLSLNSPDTVSSIYLSQTTSDTLNYAINYGVVQMANNLKDSRSTRGN